MSQGPPSGGWTDDWYQPDHQHTDPQYTDARYTDPQYTDPRYPDSDYADHQYAENDEYTEAGDSRQGKRRTRLLMLVGVLLLLNGGAAAFLFLDGPFNSQDDDPTERRVPEPAVGQPFGLDGSLATPDAGGAEALGVKACSRLDADTLLLDVFNESPNTLSYVITVAFVDGGQRVADSTEVLNYVRPGERATEQLVLADVPAGDCQVLDVKRSTTEPDLAQMAAVPACQIHGIDVIGLVEARLKATNETPEQSDYRINAAFVDVNGVRVGSAFGSIEEVPPGETGPGDLFGYVEDRPGLTCEVTAVERTASN